MMAQRLARRDWRSGGPRFKSHPRLTFQSWSSYQLNQLGSKAASDSTLKQLTTCGVSNTCTSLFTIIDLEMLVVSCQFLDQTINLSTAFCRGFESDESIVISLYNLTSSAYNLHVTGELKRNPRSYNWVKIYFSWKISLFLRMNVFLQYIDDCWFVESCFIFGCPSFRHLRHSVNEDFRKMLVDYC